jgi:hypothetical protein
MVFLFYVRGLKRYIPQRRENSGTEMISHLLKDIGWKCILRAGSGMLRFRCFSKDQFQTQTINPGDSHSGITG